MDKIPDSDDFDIKGLEGIKFDTDFPNDDIETEKMQLLKDIWHNQATEIKWLAKIYEELKKANKK